MRKPIVALCALLALTLAAAGEDDAKADPPRSTKAKTALKKYDRTVEKARAAYDQAVAAAGKELGAELDLALKQAMKAGSLDEAKRIEAAKLARSGADGPAADGEGRTGAAAGTGAGQRGIVGAWTVRYGNGNERKYTIAADGRLSMDGGPMAKLTRAPDGEGLLLDFNDGKVERLRLVDGSMLLVEHFNPKSDLAEGEFDTLGLGRRER